MFEDKILEHNFRLAVEAFNKYDLYGLLKLGAPWDEYYFEAFMLADCITDGVTYELLQGAVYGLLYRCFRHANANMADRVAGYLADKWVDSGDELMPIEQLMLLRSRLDEYVPDRDEMEDRLGCGVALHFVGKLSLL